MSPGLITARAVVTRHKITNRSVAATDGAAVGEAASFSTPGGGGTVNVNATDSIVQARPTSLSIVAISVTDPVFWAAALSVVGTGAIKPDATNTGVPASMVAGLTPRTTTWTITTAGTVIDGYNISAQIFVKAANVIIRNCIIRGPGIGTDSALVDCNNQACVNCLVSFCTLAMDNPTVWINGLIGHDYTVQYCNIYHVTDGCGVYNNNGGHTTDQLNVTILGNYIHDVALMSPDPEQPDNHTHNDCVQIQSGASGSHPDDVLIQGNNFTDNCAPSPYSNITTAYNPSATGQCVAFTPNVSDISNVTIISNWMDYGAQSVTIVPKRSSGVIIHTVQGATCRIQNNMFGTNQPNKTIAGVGAARRAIACDPSISIAGFPSSTALDSTQGNKMFDGTQCKIWIVAP